MRYDGPATGMGVFLSNKYQAPKLLRGSVKEATFGPSWSRVSSFGRAVARKLAGGNP